jgi:hypothetical protein
LEQIDPFFVTGSGYSSGLDLSVQCIGKRGQIWAAYLLGLAQKTLPFQYPQPREESVCPRYDQHHSMTLDTFYELLPSLNISAILSASSGAPFGFMTDSYYRRSGWVISPAADYPSHHPQEPLTYFVAMPSDRDAVRFPWYHRLDVTLQYETS